MEPQPVQFADSQSVALYLWGRDVPKHVVLDGECPYHFGTGDVTKIGEVLEHYPASVMRTLLRAPWQGASWHLDICLTLYDPQPPHVLCHIGGPIALEEDAA